MLRKVLHSLMAVLIVCVFCVSAFAQEIQPRYTNINALTYGATKSGDGIDIVATLETRKSMSLKISVKVTEDGTTVDTFSESGTDYGIALSETTPCESGHVYKVYFTFTAGGETDTATKTVRT